MLTALIVDAFTYDFLLGSPHIYQVKVALEGTLPILGGKEGKATLDFDIRVTMDPQSRSAFLYELISFRSSLNGAILPFGLTNIAEFFPASRVSYFPSGRISHSSAPMKVLPAALPGFDTQHLPEVTFMPLEFPDSGSKWSFQRIFQGEPIQYQASTTEQQNAIEVAFEAQQTARRWETASGLPAKDKATGEFEATSTLKAKGVAKFSTKLQVMTDCSTKIVIEGDARRTSDQSVTHRKLTLLIETKRN